MNRTMLTAITIAWAACVAGADPPGESKKDVLAGPVVAERREVTLLQRESDGRLKRTETPPEVAAVKLLHLAPEVREKIDGVLHRRARFLESFVADNLELLGRLDTAGNTGNALDQTLLVVQVLGKLTPLTREGSLRKQVREVLTSEEAKGFDRLLDEYWEAIISQTKQAEPKSPRVAIVLRERMESLAREVEAAYKRLEKSGELLFKYFFGEIELGKEQEAEIRTLLDEFMEKTGGTPTKRQEQEIFLGVMARLDPRQQTALVKRFRGEFGGKPE